MDRNNPLYICFHDLEDPRKEKHSSRHSLMDILMLAILGVICGADSWVAVEKFGHAKKQWLETFLELPNGIPSHDTIGDFFARVNPTQLQNCFLRWIRMIFKYSHGEIIAIDGKNYDTLMTRPTIVLPFIW